MKIPVGEKRVINVNGLAVIVTALIVDNTVANICRLKALKYLAKAKTNEEEESE